MKLPVIIHRARGYPAISHSALMVLAGSGVLFAAYWITFALTTDGGLSDNAGSAARNAIPAILLGLLTHFFLERFIWRQGHWIRLVVHPPLAALFAVSLYLAILVMHGLDKDWLTQGFAIRPFVPIAFVWQMFQGVTLYAVAALASLVVSLSHRLDRAQSPLLPPRETNPAAILVKNHKEHESVAVDEIVRVSGAGDYTEVVLRTRRILSTSSLGEFEEALPDEGFLRIHRSHLVRLAAIERTEPAGNGRTSVHLKNGDDLISSRSGTRLLREIAL